MKIEEDYKERFVKLIGFFIIQNSHDGIVDFDGLMNDLIKTSQYQQILENQEKARLWDAIIPIEVKRYEKNQIIVEKLKEHKVTCITPFCICNTILVNEK